MMRGSKKGGELTQKIKFSFTTNRSLYVEPMEITYIFAKF